MNNNIAGTVHSGVKIGDNAIVLEDSVVMSGEIPDFGCIDRGDIVERSYAYDIPGSKYGLTVTENNVSIGCLTIPIDMIDDITERDVLILCGKRGVSWYRKFKDLARKIYDDDAKNRL